MKIAQTILDLIGDTPLVKLNSVTTGIAATVLVKLEYLNPGGSSKDRIATRIIDAAERDGLLLPGYTCVFVLPDKVGEDKRNVLTAYGAQIVVTPTSVAPDDPESYYSVSDRLAREIPGAFKPNQYANPNGPLSHYETTGPEIWRDTDGTVTHFVAGVGTGGTITGTGRYLREVSGDTVTIIGADPEGSVYSGGTGRPYLVEGVGEDFWPAAYDPSVVHEVIAVSDADSFAMTRRLALEEGILVGGSSGMAVVAALRAAQKLTASDTVVVLLPDGGRGYLGKIFNDDWMRSYGFTNAPAGHTVGELLSAKTGTLPAFVYVRPSDTVRDAIEAMTSSSVSQLLVLNAKPPVVMGEVVGALDERALMDLVFSGKAKLTDPVGGFVGAALPLIGANEPVASARAAFAQHDALLVTAEGKPLGVVTRHDLLNYLSASST